MTRPTTIAEAEKRLRIAWFRLATLRGPYRIDAASHVRQAELWLAELKADSAAMAAE